MRDITKLQKLILSALMSLIIRYQAVGQELTYMYSYIEIAPHGDSALIHVIDPQYPDQRASTYPYPLPEGWIFSPRFQSVVSPDGKWVASTLFATDHSRLMIYLLNVETWQGVQLIEGFLTNNSQNLAWSPNSQYLAINIQEMNQHDTDIFIYEIETGSLVDLSNNTAQQRDISWSNDSRHVLTFNQPCAVSQSCPSQLSLYDIENHHQENSIELTELPFLGSSACDPKVSPNGQVVALIANCGVGVPFSSDFPNEIYIWDIALNQLTQVTAYAEGETAFLARYQHEWLNDEMLLIGANYRNGGEQEQRQLTLFQRDNPHLIPLSNNIGAGFMSDTTREQILLQSRLFYTDQLGQAALAFSTFATLADATDTTHAEIQFSLEVDSICVSSWSPSGQLVAITLSTNDCDLSLESLVFLSPNQRINAQHTLKTISQIPNMYYVPLGWLQLIQHSNKVAVCPHQTNC